MSTPTPRTDSEEYPEGEGQSFHVVSADFARTLERELATERAIVSRIWVQLGSPTYAQLKGRSIYDLIDEMKAELASERARLDSGTILLAVAGERVWHCGVDLRAAIDAGIKEGTK